MEKIILNAQARETTGKSANKQLRQNYIIPAVVYKRSEKTMHIQIKETDLIHVLHTSAGENAIITLKLSHAAKTKAKTAEDTDGKTVIIKDIQYHPTKENILHVDFQEISLTEKITVKVPIVLKGEATQVKAEGGILEQTTKELEIECLPTQIPQKFELNVEAMKIGDIIYVKDLNIPEGVKVLTEKEQAVISVSMPKAEEVPVAGAEEGLAEPEVITERKPEEEEAEAEEDAKEKKSEKKEEAKEKQPRQEKEK